MFNFSKVMDHHGTWCTQWDYVTDHFSTADLLPFTISDMDFATAPCIIKALNQHLMHSIFGYSHWKNNEFLTAIAHWFSTQHYTTINPQSVVYGPSVIYMVSELIHQWSETGEGMVIHTPTYDTFYKAIEGNQHTVMPIALEKQADSWFCNMGKLEAMLAKPECKIMLLCSPQNPTRKVWTCNELEIMADLCKHHGVQVISNEIHMDMVWGKQPHIPWSNVAQGDWALLTSGSKSFNIPTLTSAYGIIENSSSHNAYLSALKGHDGLSSPSVLALTAHITTYQKGAPWLDALHVYLKDNLTYITDKMNTTFPELNWQIPQSTYLAWLDLHPLNIDNNTLQKALIKQEKVTIMPGYTYSEEGHGFVQLNASCPHSKLEKGVAGLINTIHAVH